MSACPACGVALVWGVTHEGDRIPIEATPTTIGPRYAADFGPDTVRLTAMHPGYPAQGYADHRASCPAK